MKGRLLVVAVLTAAATGLLATTYERPGGPSVPVAAFDTADWSGDARQLRCPSGQQVYGAPPLSRYAPGEPVGERSAAEMLGQIEASLTRLMAASDRAGVLTADRVQRREVAPGTWESRVFREDGAPIAWASARVVRDGSWVHAGMTMCSSAPPIVDPAPQPPGPFAHAP